MAKRIIRLTESDLEKLIRRVVKEQEDMSSDPITVIRNCIEKNAPSVEIDISKIPQSCKNVVQAIQQNGAPDPLDTIKCGAYVKTEIGKAGWEAATKAIDIMNCIKNKMSK